MTGYLLDTNALSEAPKKSPDSGFMDWFMAANELSLFTSCIVIGEIAKGVSLCANSLQRKRLAAWLSDVTQAFDGRIMEVDQDVCLLWGELMGAGQLHGKTPPAIDALIAAQCIHNRLTLVTRNIGDFDQFERLKVMCPWSGR